ncbi:hypothetical protein JG687_00008010 [Phytophthora cactorum]|uniref:SprT-like domain-containing protein n=1 Tax=Phytophthora cactorum TaxID=29920 RepID=A0A8T1UGS4_9STRA|nr:hypothetical protein JG687_00008010 [Phytophthora cactorum]
MALTHAVATARGDTLATQRCDLLAPENEYLGICLSLHPFPLLLRGFNDEMPHCFPVPDPNPDLHSLFQEYNRMFFEGRLAGCEVKWSKRMTLCFQPRSGFCSIRLSEPLLKLRPRSDMVNTLLHEMIHAYVFVATPVRDHDDHGPLFQAHMNRINEAAKTKITVFHTFHDEVDSYRQHVWQCNGPCRHTRPYFGLVKSYTKIKEPAEFTAKQAKKKERELAREEKQKKKNKEAKAPPSVKQFFPTIKEDSDTKSGDSKQPARAEKKPPRVGKKAPSHPGTGNDNPKKQKTEHDGDDKSSVWPMLGFPPSAPVVFSVDGDEDGMDEAQKMCEYLYSLLKTVHGQLKNGKNVNCSPITRFVAVLTTFVKFLRLFSKKELLFRVCKHLVILNELHHIYEDVVETLSIATSVNWAEQWCDDVQAQEAVLAATVSDPAMVFSQLQDSQSQVEALLTLKFELEQRAACQSGESADHLKLMLELEAKPFARGPMGSLSHGVWGPVTRVAVKQFFVDSMGINKRTTQHIEAELDQLHQLAHPNLLKLLGASHVSSPPFIVWEDAVYRDLGSLLSRCDDNNSTSDDAWELVQSMTDADPGKRVSLEHVIAQLKRLAADETAIDAHAAAQAATTCSICSSEMAIDSRFYLFLSLRADLRGILLTLIDSSFLTAELEVLEESVRDATSDECTFLMNDLRYGLEEEKLKAIMYCNKRLTVWTVDAIGNLADNDDARVVIANEGAVAPLIELLHAGSNAEKGLAAYALGRLACDSKTNSLAFEAGGAISYLVELLSSTDELKASASATLSSLATIDSICPVLTEEGVIAPLIKLLRTGNEEQKGNATSALANVAVTSSSYCEESMEEGGLDPGYSRAVEKLGVGPLLVNMLHDGNLELKEHAAYALERLTKTGDATLTAMTKDS